MKPSQLQTALFLNMEILTKEFGFLPAFEVGKKGEVSVLTLDGWKPARVEVAPKQNLIELKGPGFECNVTASIGQKLLVRKGVDEYEAVEARNLLGEDLCFAVNPWRPFDQEEIRKGIKTFLSNPSVKSGVNNELFMAFMKGSVSFKYGWIMAYIEAFSQKITPGVGRRVAVKLLPDVCFPSLLKAGFWDAGIMLERDLGSPEEIFLREEYLLGQDLLSEGGASGSFFADSKRAVAHKIYETSWRGLIESFNVVGVDNYVGSNGVIVINEG